MVGEEVKDNSISGQETDANQEATDTSENTNHKTNKSFHQKEMELAEEVNKSINGLS